MGSRLRYNFAAESFYTMKLCGRLLMVFFVKIYAQNVKSGYLNPIFGKFGVTHKLGTTLVDGSLESHESFFTIYYNSGVMRLNAYSSAVFTGSWPLCTQILAGWGCPSPTILGIRKLEALGYSMVKTASIRIPSFWHNTGVWRTDGNTEGFAIAYIALPLWSAVKMPEAFLHTCLRIVNITQKDKIRNEIMKKTIWQDVYIKIP